MTGFTGAIAAAQAAAGQPVTAYDKLDVDQVQDEYAQALGVPPSIIRSDDDVAAIRQQRAQAQQAQQMAQMAGPMKDAAQAAHTMSQTPVGKTNALDAVTQ
jgi:hypothetical protein